MNLTLEVLVEQVGEAEIRWLKHIAGKQDQITQDNFNFEAILKFVLSILL